jgi:hypothetical protein
VSVAIAANGQDLLLCWNFITPNQEQQPNKNTKVEDNKQKPTRITSAGTVADSEQKEEDLFVSQNSSKPHVMRLFYSRHEDV